MDASTWLCRDFVLARCDWGFILCLSAPPKRVLPEQDTGRVEAFIRGDDGFSFQIMQPKIAAFSQSLLSDPAVKDVVGTSGGAGGTTNSFSW
jgi:multidrug efflux pump